MNTNLRTAAEQALSEMRRQLEAEGCVRFYLAACYPDGRIQKLPLPESINPGLNDGAFKSRFFGVMRLYMERTGATAVVFGHDSWVGLPTEKQERMAREDPQELCRIASGSSFDELEARGFVTRSEALTVTVQDRERALVLTQPYDRAPRKGRPDHILWGDRNERITAQSDFSGRAKMFGQTA